MCNLCNLWVTDTSYHNQRSVRTNTRKHPVLLGSLFFHFTKDVTTFPQFALEIKIHGITKDIRKVVADLEKVIWQGFKQIFPISKPLYCVGQLQERDKKKIEKLLSKTHSNAAEKKKAKSEIFNDLYGVREGGTYENGLAESGNENDFLTKLNSLEKIWESLCPGFFEWFVLKRKQKIIESVIVSARDGINLDGLHYQNDIESIHFAEKMRQYFSKKSVNEFIESFESFCNRQDQRAFCGSRSISVATEYEKFKVDSVQWRRWSMKKRQEHVKRFHNYRENLADAYKKPRNSGRKPGAYARSKRPNKEPDPDYG